jgi:septal ring factor EnvC (AmiA/AmiB activator)
MGKEASNVRSECAQIKSCTQTSPVQKKQDCEILKDIGLSSNCNTAALEKVIQQRVDKITSKLGKQKAELSRELDMLRREKESQENNCKAELSEKKRRITELEGLLKEREHCLYAIRAIKKAGMDDGSERALEIVEFVLGDTEDEIDKKVASFRNVLQLFSE